jgi:hypothetical protein
MSQKPIKALRPVDTEPCPLTEVYSYLLDIYWTLRARSTHNYMGSLASPTGYAFLSQISALEMRWDTLPFGVSRMFSE